MAKEGNRPFAFDQGRKDAAGERSRRGTSLLEELAGIWPTFRIFSSTFG